MGTEAVNHPAHYNIGGNIEVIDAIEDWKLNFSRGNAVKYIARAGIKDKNKEIEDLEKAKWYLEREIERLKKEDRKNPVEQYISCEEPRTFCIQATPSGAVVQSYGTKVNKEYITEDYLETNIKHFQD